MPTNKLRGLPANGRSPLLIFAGSLLLVAALLALLWYFGVQRELVTLLEWVQAQGAWSALIFVLIMAVVVVLVMQTNLVSRLVHPVIAWLMAWAG